MHNKFCKVEKGVLQLKWFFLRTVHRKVFWELKMVHHCETAFLEPLLLKVSIYRIYSRSWFYSNPSNEQ